MAAAKSLTYRDLLTLARERFGPAAAALKTRDELVRALGLQTEVTVEVDAVPPALVTSDFFIARSKSPAKN